MNTKHTRRLSMTVGVILAFGTLATPQAASADAGDWQKPESFHARMPMTIVGYDAAIAEANGFKIVTNESGVTHSEPVTESARALIAGAGKSPGLSPYDTAVGNCGQSWLNGSKGANDNVSFTTGYSVRLRVVMHQWRVAAVGAITVGEKNYAQGPGAAVWSTSDTTKAIGPGWATVPVLSPVAMVKLTDGSTCYSGGPSFWFG